MKNNGFTLSEILLTLGIISVIAAMVIPAINAKIEDIQTKTKAKKAYSTIVNVTNAIMAANGGSMEMQVDGLLGGSIGDDLKIITIFYKNVYGKHISHSAECDTKAACQGKLWPLHSGWYDANGLSVEGRGGYFVEAVLLGLDGIAYRLYFHHPDCSYTGNRFPDTCGSIYFDVNGLKPPNTIGKDIFQVSINRYKSIPSYELKNILIK